MLGELLLERSNLKVMVRYVADEENLKLMMNLLKDQSRSIQFEAFHVFKVSCLYLKFYTAHVLVYSACIVVHAAVPRMAAVTFSTFLLCRNLSAIMGTRDDVIVKLLVVMHSVEQILLCAGVCCQPKQN